MVNGAEENKILNEKPQPPRVMPSLAKVRQPYAILRIIAYLIDINLATAVAIYIFFLLDTSVVEKYVRSENALYAIFFLGHIVFYVVGNWLYTAGFESSKLQSTPGKLLFSYKVTDSQGNRLTFSAATKRFFCKILTICTCGMGFIVPAFTGRRILHDYLSDTKVVIK